MNSDTITTIIFNTSICLESMGYLHQLYYLFLKLRLTRSEKKGCHKYLFECPLSLKCLLISDIAILVTFDIRFSYIPMLLNKFIFLSDSNWCLHLFKLVFLFTLNMFEPWQSRSQLKRQPCTGKGRCSKHIYHILQS